MVVFVLLSLAIVSGNAVCVNKTIRVAALSIVCWCVTLCRMH